MADKTIGSLPQATTVDDASLFVCEQQGVAMKTTGAQWKGFAVQAVSQYVEPAQQAAQQAQASATAAAGSASTASKAATDAQQAKTDAETARDGAEAAQDAAENAQSAIEGMTVTSETLPPGSDATVEKTVSETGAVNLEFGIPQGVPGNIMYATFSVDPTTGLLTMTTPDGYNGPVFSIVNGFLEVSING